jgi:hypothetical protein
MLFAGRLKKIPISRAQQIRLGDPRTCLLRDFVLLALADPREAALCY